LILFELKKGLLTFFSSVFLINIHSCFFFRDLMSIRNFNPIHTSYHQTNTGKQQIIGLIFLTEIITESQEKHYLRGGDLPTIVFPPVDFSRVDAETLKTKQNRELNNGRLAMIAVMSFVAAANVPGSVPALAGNPMF
jgi:hypothetical protein